MNANKISFASLLAVACISLFSAFNANASRMKYALQQFEIDKLKLEFVVPQKDGCLYAEILGPDGFLYPALVGTYIGKNNGKIISIEKDGINVEEVVAQGDGWATRNIFLKLSSGK